jgi:DNA processing protein
MSDMFPSEEEPGRTRGGRILTLTPTQLLGPLNEVERKYAPHHLYVSGTIKAPLAHPRVAIIGTRQPSSEGLVAATMLAGALAKHGVLIVSGLAQGIDTAAHTEAIRAGGQTIAVLGTPLDQVYPKTNAQLQHTIMEHHLAVTQFAQGHPVQPKNFILRNRTMALLSDASIIVESGEKGGALSQGWESIRLGRPLFLWKSMMRDVSLSWPREMTQYGAVELSDPNEVLEVLPSSTDLPVTIDAALQA